MLKQALKCRDYPILLPYLCCVIMHGYMQQPVNWQRHTDCAPWKAFVSPLSKARSSSVLNMSGEPASCAYGKASGRYACPGRQHSLMSQSKHA